MTDQSLNDLSPRLAGGRLTIDLGALAANWRDLAARAKGATTAAVVKGDGYGIGLEPAAHALAGAGCDTFFVALPEEGLRLRRALPRATVYVLDGLFEASADIYAAADLRPVSRLSRDRGVGGLSPLGGVTGAALHVDTGMNRLGLLGRRGRSASGRRDLLEDLGRRC